MWDHAMYPKLYKEMLTDAFRVMVNSPFKESFYRKKRKKKSD